MANVFVDSQYNGDINGTLHDIFFASLYISHSIFPLETNRKFKNTFLKIGHGINFDFFCVWLVQYTEKIWLKRFGRTQKNFLDIIQPRCV